MAKRFHWFLPALLLAGVSTPLLIRPPSLPAQADYRRFWDEDKLPEVRRFFLDGRYDIVLQICDYALRRGQPSWEWRTLRMRSLGQLGEYEDALAEAAAIAEKFPDQLGALLAVHEFFTETGRAEQAAALLDPLDVAASAVPVKDRDGLDLVRLGRAALVLGAEPQTVLDQYFGPAKQQEAKGQNTPPGLVEAHRAIGELALSKDDFTLAAKEFRAALEHDPDHPELRYGLARALLPGDSGKGLAELQKITEANVLHFGALLLQAEHQIHYEHYDRAEQIASLVLAINERHPEAHALRAVIAELRDSDAEAFAAARKKALAPWPENPAIDHLIGRVLSRNYRFAEGAASQRRALELDPAFTPAKIQLALDFLRLGELEKAWPLAREAGEEDPFNVLAHNLVILQEEVENFATIETPHFRIRMPEEEAELYGDRALEILEEARVVLEEKYGLRIGHPVLVEFYPDQQDFAIRSFGNLGGAGLLGVCFGSVVTMNSPGSLAHGKNNWEATLWHEYCHVITLTATKNKLPRWLSEGISVHEEKQRDPRWGQHMTPQYREKILEEDGLTPIGEMSQAFYRAGSGEDIMFAYFQSMMVVDYLVENFGHEALHGILADLADGVLVNEALAEHAVPLPELEQGFAEYAVAEAEALAPEVDWEKPDPEKFNPANPLAMGAFLKKNPNNFWSRQAYTLHLLREKMWDRALASAEALIQLYPDYAGPESGYELKARAYRGLEKPEKEAAALEKLAKKSAEAYPAYARLLELNFDSKDWPAVKENADRAQAINPFHKPLHYCRGCAHQALGEDSQAISAFEKTLSLGPANPSEVRYRLATLLKSKQPKNAKRHLLDALADSPRYREAHALLLEFGE